ncbi:MAG: hypothetical protein LBE91_21360, partial [Tannerella sp.]|nr:hypothetical protein [Tannerella sp.]
MRLNFFKHLMVIVIFAGLFYSCDKDDDIDMSKIDFSNIENLHEQPLQVIQKCVEGKWLWYSSCCGISGQPNYSD